MMATLTTTDQYCIGGSSYGDWGRKEIKGIQIGKERVKLYCHMMWSVMQKTPNNPQKIGGNKLIAQNFIFHNQEHKIIFIFTHCQ